jgi:hypothetical protein
MVAGGDSIDDMRLLRHGAMGTLLARPYAPSTLGSFLREFRFGHVRQLDAVATRLLTGLCQRTRVRVLANKAHFEPELPLPTLVSGDLASTPPKGHRCRDAQVVGPNRTVRGCGYSTSLSSSSPDHRGRTGGERIPGQR